MKFTFTLTFAILVLFSCSDSFEKGIMTVTRQAAEFETLDAVWLIWPEVDHKKGESVQSVTISIIDALINDLEVVVTCSGKEALIEAKGVLNKHFSKSDNLTILELQSFEIWARDMGPIFVETNQNTLAIADFNFDAWGYSDTLDPDVKLDETYDERVAKLLNLPLISSTMISEGGNREVNGKGILMTTESVEQGRNPTMSKQEMELEYKRLMGIKKTIWLKKGLVEDDHTFLGPVTTSNGEKAYTVLTTNGHVDEFARFVNDSTILLGQIDSTEFHDSIAFENHKRLEENYRILKNSSDQNGNPFTIIRMPLPGVILTTMSPGDYVYDYIKTLDFTDGSTFPDGDTINVIAAFSYLNFLITNTVIVGQTCWREGLPNEPKLKDEKAANILKSVFPDRKVIMLDAMAVNLGGGGVHCISMQQPAFIKQ